MADNIVYSTEKGDLRTGPEKKKTPGKKRDGGQPVKKDGIVRVGKESRGRGGKTVSVITGLPFSGDKLQSFASGLKRKFGTGGSVSDGGIIIQGDIVDSLITYFKDQGYFVKRSGG